DGVRVMLATAGNDRDRAMLRLLHDLGLRRSEVVGLDLADVDIEGGFVWILGKGRTQKEHLTLPEPTKAALGTWIEKRGAEPGPLFLNFDRARKGHRLTAAGLSHVVGKLGQQAGLEVPPHGVH